MNEKGNLPSIYYDSISLACTTHAHSPRFETNQNFSRPNVRTNYGIFTFKFISSKIWESTAGLSEPYLINSLDLVMTLP